MTSNCGSVNVPVINYFIHMKLSFRSIIRKNCPIYKVHFIDVMQRTFGIMANSSVMAHILGSVNFFEFTYTYSKIALENNFFQVFLMVDLPIICLC